MIEHIIVKKIRQRAGKHGISLEQELTKEYLPVVHTPASKIFNLNPGERKVKSQGDLQMYLGKLPFTQGSFVTGNMLTEVSTLSQVYQVVHIERSFFNIKNWSPIGNPYCVTLLGCNPDETGHPLIALESGIGRRRLSDSEINQWVSNDRVQNYLSKIIAERNWSGLISG